MSSSSTALSKRELREKFALVCRPNVACAMLDVSGPKLYELIDEKLIDSYVEGGARKITVASINKYIADRLAGENPKKEVPRSPGRPRLASALAAPTAAAPAPSRRRRTAARAVTRDGHPEG